MEKAFFNFCYIVGMISFTLTGFWNCYKQRLFHIAPLCTIFSAFGGGMFFRDIILLRTIPSAIAEKTELLMVLCFVVWLMHFYLHHEHIFSRVMQLRLVQTILDIADALGSGAFISIGYLKALQYNLPIPLCVVSGIVTTFGGGILAALARGVSLKTVLTSSVGYRVVVIANALFFCRLQHLGVPESTAKCIIISSTVFLCIGKSLVYIIFSGCHFNELPAYHISLMDNLHLKSVVILFCVICNAQHYSVIDKNIMKQFYRGQAKNAVDIHISIKLLIYRPTVFCDC